MLIHYFCFVLPPKPKSSLQHYTPFLLLSISFLLYLIEGRNEMAFVDVDSLTSCVIAIPSQKKEIVISNKEHRPSSIANVMIESKL